MANGPFEKQQNSVRSIPEDLLGEVSNVPNTLESDRKKIEHLIPEEGNSSIDEGFQKMMNILNKKAPAMEPVQQPAQQQPQQQRPVLVAQQPQLQKEQVQQSETTVSQINPQNKENQTPKTQSEILGLNYKDEEILPLIDSILQKGYASESIYIRGNKVTFRSTFAWEEQEIVTRIDNKINDGISLKATGGYFYELYSLAANLEQFGANYFAPVTHGTEEDKRKSFDDRVNFLLGLSSTLLTIINIKRADFTNKMQFLVDNSDRLLKAF